METARHRAGRMAVRLAGALAAVTLTAPLAPASADMQAGREQPLSSVERLIDAARGNGDKPIDFTLPLVRQSSNTIYLNLRAQGADALMDGDVSIAYQGSVDRALAVGGYALGVIEHGERGLAPRQITFGGEAANDWLRLNGNVCVPDTTCVAVAPPTPKGGSLADRSVVGISATALDVGGVAPTGFDAELSLHLRNPASLPGDWRLSAGASHVLDQGFGFSTAAPRGRLEVTFDEALEATGIKGAKLTVGGEMHHDESQGPLAVLSARLNIPLYGAAHR